jgi:hypothetical protein
MSNLTRWSKSSPGIAGVLVRLRTEFALSDEREAAYIRTSGHSLRPKQAPPNSSPAFRAAPRRADLLWHRAEQQSRSAARLVKAVLTAHPSGVREALINQAIALRRRKRGYFLLGTFFPARRASDRPIAMACFLLFTFRPLRPFFKVPRLRSCMARFTFFDAAFEYLRVGMECLRDTFPKAATLKATLHSGIVLRSRRPRNFFTWRSGESFEQPQQPLSFLARERREQVRINAVGNRLVTS